MNWQKVTFCMLTASLSAGYGTAYAGGPVDSIITYQGHFKDGGVPANEAYDFIFRLFDAPSGGTDEERGDRVGDPVDDPA